MKLEFNILFHNLTLLVTFIFLLLKFRTVVIKKTESKLLKLFIPFLFSLLAVLVMLFPFELNGVRIDLRSVPLFLIAFVSGWIPALIASVAPTLVRLYIGGPTAIDGVLTGILLVTLLGALFHNKEDRAVLFFSVRLRKIILAFLLMEIIQNAYLLLKVGVPFSVLLIKSIIAVFALFLMVLIVNDHNQAERLKRELEYLSTHDQKTDLLNLPSFKKKIQEHPTSFYILMLDVDHFKIYNDTHGHVAGDVVLSRVARMVKEHLREGDLAARYGGEEFIVYASNDQGLEGVERLSNQMRAVIEGFPFEGREQQPFGKVTVSIGVSQFSGGRELNAVITEADQALYSSKQAGRNRVSYYQEA